MLEKIKPIADGHNATLSQLVINWTANQRGIGCVLVGARDEKQAVVNAKSLNFKLNKEEIAAITKASDEFASL